MKTITAALVLTAASAQAQLTPATDMRFGPDSLTVDSQTGLAWLDLNFSVNMTLHQAGDLFYPLGFRSATDKEVNALFDHGGLPPFTTWVEGTAVAQLAQLFGPTSFQSGLPEAIGIVEDGRVFSLDVFRVDWTTGYLVLRGDAGGNNPNIAFPSVGHWLVTTIPEPGPLAFVALAAALFWRRK